MVIFYRKPMTVDAMKLSVSLVLGGDQGEPGDYLVTFADGSQAIYPEEVFHAEFEEGLSPRETPVIKPTQAPVAPLTKPKAEDWEEKNLPTDCTCIECGQSVKRSDWDAVSGVGKCCIMVKCLSCKRPARFSQVSGEYCPQCLPALARRDRDNNFPHLG